MLSNEDNVSKEITGNDTNEERPQTSEHSFGMASMPDVMPTETNIL